jgi:HPt (histidine-containing phosphotransfer) domain-containing protein
LVDRDSLQEIVKNNPRELLELFIQDSPQLLQALGNAVTSGDRLELRSAAHALKGAVSNFGARHPQALAAELEKVARTGDLETVQHLVDALTVEVHRLRSQLAEIAQLA